MCFLQAAIVAPKDGQNCWMRKSGNWKDSIWARENTLKPQKGLKPGRNDSAAVGLTGGILEINSPIRIFSFSQRAHKTCTKIEKGAEFTIDWFFGQRGSLRERGSDGVFDMTGGTFTVTDRFVLAGQINEDRGTGTFSQKAGTVTVGGTGIYLTGNMPLTSSQLASGIYELSGGTLNIICTTSNEAGMIKGVGNGRFDWIDGTLNATHLGIDIANTGKGNLSPGGDEAIGATRLVSKGEPTYTQGSQAKMTVNIASRHSCDQLYWLSSAPKGKSATVIIEPGSTFEIVPIRNYRPRSGDTYNVIIADEIKLNGEPNIVCESESGRSFKAKVSSTTPKKLQIVCE